jgi:hypothetical protein
VQDRQWHRMPCPRYVAPALPPAAQHKCERGVGGGGHSPRPGTPTTGVLCPRWIRLVANLLVRLVLCVRLAVCSDRQRSLCFPSRPHVPGNCVGRHVAVRTHRILTYRHCYHNPGLSLIRAAKCYLGRVQNRALLSQNRLKASQAGTTVASRPAADWRGSDGADVTF